MQRYYFFRTYARKSAFLVDFVAISVREGGVVSVVVDYCVVCGMGSRVDDQKWELVPVLITKNRLFESRGGACIKIDKLIKK